MCSDWVVRAAFLLLQSHENALEDKRSTSENVSKLINFERNVPRGQRSHWKAMKKNSFSSPQFLGPWVELYFNSCDWREQRDSSEQYEETTHDTQIGYVIVKADCQSSYSLARCPPKLKKKNSWVGFSTWALESEKSPPNQQ